jgi:hypothetical protein
MPELNHASPLKLLDADENRIAFLYLLSGGNYDSRVVMVSSVVTPTYEETSVFLCSDWEGVEADWGNAISKIYYVDTEDALNQIGYTTKVGLDKEKQ